MKQFSTLKSSLGRTKRRVFVAGLVALLLAGTIAAVYVVTRPDVVEKASKNHGAVVSVSTDQPDEKKIDKDEYQWLGSPNEPKYIALPSIGTAGFVQKMGVDQDKQIAVPTNIHLGGWFVNSVKPGSRGLSIIIGHVNGRVSNDGIFKDLGKLKPGAIVEVTSGDDTTYQYEVMANDTYKTADTPNYLFSQSPEIASQLNLVTCTGTYDKQAESYDKRVVVTAKMIRTMPEPNRQRSQNL